MWLVCRNIDMCFATFPASQMPAARRVEAVLEEEERRDTLSKSQAFYLA
jgi:hypothetical protein